MTKRSRSGPTVEYAFPPGPAGLTDRAAPENEAAAFVLAVDRWRARASDWMTEQTAKGSISRGLAELLRWSLGGPGAEVTPPGPYALTQVPTRGDLAGEDALAIMVWRSGLVDFLSDIWDTMGPTDFDLKECALVIDDLLTPTVLKGVLACPDCLRTAVDSSDLAHHTIDCPVRRRRLGDG